MHGFCADAQYGLLWGYCTPLALDAFKPLPGSKVMIFRKDIDIAWRITCVRPRFLLVLRKGKQKRPPLCYLVRLGW